MKGDRTAWPLFFSSWQWAKVIHNLEQQGDRCWCCSLVVLIWAAIVTEWIIILDLLIFNPIKNFWSRIYLMPSQFCQFSPPTCIKHDRQFVIFCFLSYPPHCLATPNLKLVRWSDNLRQKSHIIVATLVTLAVYSLKRRKACNLSA